MPSIDDLGRPSYLADRIQTSPDSLVLDAWPNLWIQELRASYMAMAWVYTAGDKKRDASSLTTLIDDASDHARACPMIDGWRPQYSIEDHHRDAMSDTIATLDVTGLVSSPEDGELGLQFHPSPVDAVYYVRLSSHDGISDLPEGQDLRTSDATIYSGHSLLLDRCPWYAVIRILIILVI